MGTDSKHGRISGHLRKLGRAFVTILVFMNIFMIMMMMLMSMSMRMMMMMMTVLI